MTDPQFISVLDSPTALNPYRTWETRENSENWYGLVLSRNWGGSPDYIPVICQHGGSMWLCADCGRALLASVEHLEGQ